MKQKTVPRSQSMSVELAERLITQNLRAILMVNPQSADALLGHTGASGPIVQPPRVLTIMKNMHQCCYEDPNTLRCKLEFS